MCLDSRTHAMLTVYVLCGNGENHEYDHERHVLSKFSSRTIGKFSPTFHLRSSNERTLSTLSSSSSSSYILSLFNLSLFLSLSLSDFYRAKISKIERKISSMVFIFSRVYVKSKSS